MLPPVSSQEGVKKGVYDEGQNPLHPITKLIWWTAQPPAMPRVRAQASWMKPTIARIRASLPRGRVILAFCPMTFFYVSATRFAGRRSFVEAKYAYN